MVVSMTVVLADPGLHAASAVDLMATEARLQPLRTGQEV